ncbi:MAG TPA: response regulator [Candidatus Polarisedimenticolaceae bacterium]|nr:response regulator [Candidatus Polarisedimenticolaceae bacterium]
MEPRRILVVDDDAVTLRFVASLLEGEGYHVLVAEDGDHGLEMARRHLPDLVICDLLMPYRDGYELVRAIRSSQRLERVPVVILSMKDHEEDIVRGFQEGADDYVVKPFNARELLMRVRQQLHRPRVAS